MELGKSSKKLGRSRWCQFGLTPEWLWEFRGGQSTLLHLNEIEVIRIGRSINVITAPLRKRLGIDRAA